MVTNIFAGRVEAGGCAGVRSGLGALAYCRAASSSVCLLCESAEPRDSLPQGEDTTCLTSCSQLSPLHLVWIKATLTTRDARNMLLLPQVLLLSHTQS